MDTGYLIMNISKNLKYTLNQTLIQKGVTVQQWAVMQQLSQEKKHTAAALAYTLGMDKPTVSGILKRLELKKIVTKNSNPLDQRSYILSLTELGLTLLNEYQGISEEIVGKYLVGLSLEEQQTLNNLLLKINQENSRKEDER
ncbi:MarR family winged helix-turn-helix transcriptional regulator [uncultured Enterococcus sp.]|uniref:MarR family winged helix-turn-helix transcriptional regulator n=1 Tax=uncultured Enterococcus sp. TaxID=167972 RepID=UPI002AA6F30D|nr:MarR family winged helix-turn-helix transcriptional regulator [uncultured Enterococcus sp.]